MNITYLLILLVAFAASVRAENTLDVFVEHGERIPFITLTRAEAVTSNLFGSAQVRLAWHGSPPSDTVEIQGRFIILTLETGQISTKHPHALGYARPYEGVHASICYERIRLMDQPSLEAILLGYAITHEITHLLQGVLRHSETGIMKRYWDTGDYFQMKRGQLAFEEEDVRTIRDSFTHSFAALVPISDSLREGSRHRTSP